MHAVVVQVTIQNPDEALKELEERVVPMVSQAPGFVAGYWLAPEGNNGFSIVVFESEEQARAGCRWRAKGSARTGASTSSSARTGRRG